jgi:hypothetical protein
MGKIRKKYLIYYSLTKLIQLKMINKNIFYNPLKLNKKEIIELEKSIKNMEWYFTDTRD